MLERFLEDLADAGKPVRHSTLSELSGLTREELEVVKGSWSSLPVERRREVVAKLLDIAEDDAELSFETLFEFCLRDDDEQVRERAIAGLWECEERSVLLALIQLLRSDPSAQVRAAAAHALARFIDLCQEDKLTERDEKRLQEALLAAMTNGNETPEVRRRALEAGATLPDPRVKGLIQQAYEARDLKQRTSALYAMGRNGDPCWLPIILKEMESNSPEMRYEAAVACGIYGEGSTVPRLLALLRDDDVQVRLAAIQALGSIGGAVARKALEVELKSPDEAVQEAAGEALDQSDFQEDPLTLRPSY